MTFLTWRDRQSDVVHAVVDDTWSEPDPPFALVKLCAIDRTWFSGRRDGWFGHIESQEIRIANRREVVTCMACLASCFYT